MISGTSIHLVENGTLRQKSKRRHAQDICVEEGIFFFLILFCLPITFEYRCPFGSFLQDTGNKRYHNPLTTECEGGGANLVDATSVSLNVMIFKLCDRELTVLSKFASQNKV